MPRPSENSHITERTLMVLVITLVLLLSPVSLLWGAVDAPWYSPYVTWAVIILLSWILQKHINRHEL